MDNIYIVRGTEKAGPFTEADIRAQLASGALTVSSLVWWEGQAEWTPISRTPLAEMPSPSTAPAAPVATVAPMQLAPDPVAAMAAMPAPAKLSTMAIVSLVTGILGLPCFICWIVGLPLDLAAIITGHIALSQIARNPLERGKGMAIGGLVCGYLGVVLGILLFILTFTIGSQVKDIFATIQSQLNAAQAMTNGAPVSPNP